MPGAAKAKKAERPDGPRRAAASKGKSGGELESLVERLVGELASLRAEVALIRESSDRCGPVTRSTAIDPSNEGPAIETDTGPLDALDEVPTEHVEEAAEAVLADMVEQIGGQSNEDESAFLAEMEFAIANPDLTEVESDESGDDGDVGQTDEAELEEFGNFESGELDDLIRAFEQHDDQTAFLESSDNESRPEDGFESLLNADEPRPEEPLAGSSVAGGPAAEAKADAPRSSADEDVALSEDEIEALFAATAGLGNPVPEPEPVVPDPPKASIGAVESSDEVLSAAEIQAMLGLSEDGGPDLSLESVGQTVPDAPEPSAEFDDVVLEDTMGDVGIESDTGPSGPLTEPDWDAIDPETVRKVPAGLAVAALALPVCCSGGKLYCLCAEPVDQSGIDAIALHTGLEIEVRTAPVSQVVHELRARYGELDSDVARAASGRDGEAPRAKSLLDRVLRRSA
ncbi:MAG: hypothetical protein JST30_03130 [Armatimonadetes bacterium]|nr:hypothetical protein [Armatimonadota bacterium]